MKTSQDIDAPVIVNIETNEHTNRLKYELESTSIFKLIIKNAVPAIMANIVLALYNIVDRIFIGKWLGTDPFAGVSLLLPIFTLFIAFGVLVGIGSGVLVGIKLGERDYKYVHKVIANVFFIYFIFSLVIAVLSFFYMDKVLYMFGASETTFVYAKQYISIILPFLFFQFIGMGMNHLIRAESNAKVAMFTVVIASLTNIILDIVFMFGFGMGVRGAALATAISMVFSGIWVIHHFAISDKSFIKFNFRDKKFFIESLDLSIIKSIFHIGFPAFFMQFVSSFIIIIFNRQLIYYGGDTSVGAMGILNTIFMVVFMLLIGLNQGSQPIFSYNYGAKNFERVKRTLFVSLMLTLCITLPFFLIINIFTESIVRVFVKDDLQLLSLGIIGLKRFMSMIILAGFNLIFIQYLQSTGKPKEAMFLAVFRQLLIFIPFIVLLPKYFGLNAIWYSAPISDIFTFLLSLIILKKQLRLLNIKILTN